MIENRKFRLKFEKKSKSCRQTIRRANSAIRWNEIHVGHKNLRFHSEFRTRKIYDHKEGENISMLGFLHPEVLGKMSDFVLYPLYFCIFEHFTLYPIANTKNSESFSHVSSYADFMCKILFGFQKGGNQTAMEFFCASDFVCVLRCKLIPLSFRFHRFRKFWHSADGVFHFACLLFSYVIKFIKKNFLLSVKAMSSGWFGYEFESEYFYPFPNITTTSTNMTTTTTTTTF